MQKYSFNNVQDFQKISNSFLAIAHYNPYCTISVFNSDPALEVPATYLYKIYRSEWLHLAGFNAIPNTNSSISTMSSHKIKVSFQLQSPHQQIPQNCHIIVHFHNKQQ
jgi:hypothetical protein